MKLYASSMGLAALLACGAAHANPVSEQQTWKHTYEVSSASPRLLVRNIWGNVSVRTGPTSQIIVSATEHRFAADRERFEQSKEELRLDVAADADGVSLIVDAPERKDGRTHVCEGCRLEYQFEITVPGGTQVDIATVTDGRVEVDGVTGRVSATNVNGPVEVTGVSECSKIESVNGALDVTFARAPGTNCSLKTINGEITIALPPDSSLDAILTVAHGAIESDFDVQPLTLPAVSETRRDDDQWSYRVQRAAGLRVGSGGPTFTFASLNGDVRILKNK